VVVLFVVSLVYATVLVVVAIFVRADPSFLEFSLRNPELAYLRRDAAVALGAVFAIALWSGVLWTLLASRAFKGQFASD
jgi:hypothetical protein